jgi:hypothetical protein
MGGKVDMIKSAISLQDLRRRIYIKEKAELALRSWWRKDFGWKKWSSQWIYKELGLFNDYHLRRPKLSMAKATPVR